MTLIAVSGEAGCLMIGIFSTEIITVMTPKAVAWQIVLITGMARIAVYRCMGALKGKTRYSHMIEFRTLPAYFVMAAFAIGGKTEIEVRGINTVIISGFVAGQANGRGTSKSFSMTLIAINPGMGSL
jgi:hypothetical protein